MEMSNVVDLTEELRAKVIEAVKTGNEKIVNAAIEALLKCLRDGYDEADPIMDEFPTFFCAWCGQIHRSEVCNAELQEYYEKHPGERK